jgi:hypothetical protein
MEDEITRAVEAAGWNVRRAHPYKDYERHGFIGSQKEGMCVFAGIDPNAKLIVAEAVWQYSHHVLRTLEHRADPHCTTGRARRAWSACSTQRLLTKARSTHPLEEDHSLNSWKLPWLKGGNQARPSTSRAEATRSAERTQVGQALAE